MKNSCLKNKFKNNSLRYPVIAVLCSAVLILLLYISQAISPFGYNTVYQMDLYHQYGPMFAEFYDRLTSGGSLLYSWQSGGGGAFIGNFFNYMCSPFSLLVFIFGRANIPEAIAAMIFLKCVLASFTFSLFISRKSDRSSPAVSAFGVLYSCSAWFVAYYWNVMWLDAFYLFPLVMLGIEKLVHEKKCALYTLSLAFTLITNYYMGYMVCIFSVIYYFCTILLVKDNDGEKTVLPKSLKELLSSDFIRRCLRFAVCSITAGLIAAAVLLPVFLCLRTSSATSNEFPTEHEFYFSVFDFIANHFASLETTQRSSHGYFAPNVYCGIITVLLIPLFALCKKISVKEKIVSAVLLVFMFFSFSSSYLDFIWHGFHFPNDLPYRFSFMYSFLLLTLAFRTLTFIDSFNKKQILLSAGSLIVFLTLVQKIGSAKFDDSSFYISIAFIIIYTLFLIILSSNEKQKKLVVSLLLVTVCAEYIIGNTFNYDMQIAKEDVTYNYDSFTQLHSDNKDDQFVRSATTFNESMMDASWYGYDGIGMFSSMAYESTARLHNALGTLSNKINSASYNPQTPIYNAFFDLKYFYGTSIGSLSQYTSSYFDYSDRSGLLTEYTNPYPLSLGFAVDKALENWSVEKEENEANDPFYAQSQLFRLSTGCKDVFKYAGLQKIKCSDCKIEDHGSDSSYTYYSTHPEIFEKKDNSENSENKYADVFSKLKPKITAEYETACDGEVYIYYFGADDGNAFISAKSPDSTAAASFQFSREGFCILDFGYAKKGDKLIIEISPEENYTEDFEIYAVSLNESVFKNGYDKLKANRLTLTEFGDTHLKGEIEVPENSMIYTSINYDDGWKVTLDGSEVTDEEIVKIGNALIGIKAEAGRHTVEMNFTPRGLKTGIVISAAAALSFCAVEFIIHRKRKQQEKKAL